MTITPKPQNLKTSKQKNKNKTLKRLSGLYSLKRNFCFVFPCVFFLKCKKRLVFFVFWWFSLTINLQKNKENKFFLFFWNAPFLHSLWRPGGAPATPPELFLQPGTPRGPPPATPAPFTPPFINQHSKVGSRLLRQLRSAQQYWLRGQDLWQLVHRSNGSW